MKSQKRPKIKDVARLAGVSESAVSAVMNNRVGQGIRVSEATQQKIHEAVHQLGYIANPAARSLAGGQSNIIAVFTFEAIFPMQHRNFYYPFLIGIEQEAERQGYDLLLITGTGGSGSKVRNIYQNNVNRLALADGAILLGRENKEELLRLLEDEFPFVFIGRRDLPGDGHSYVMMDYVNASAEIVEYVASKGHEHFVYFQSTAKNNEPSWDRLQGVRLGFERIRKDPEDVVIWAGQADNLTASIINGYIEDGVTAFISEDNLIGNRILTLAEDMGLRCPEDFSLAVLGDTDTVPRHDHPWTMWRSPRQEAGAEAVHLLAQMLSDPNWQKNAPFRSVKKCNFIAGNTVAPPKGT
jgi:DNA-binding LacI/PurR family transcriptional regulator